MRLALPERYLKDPQHPGKLLSRRVLRHNPESLARGDPSEAAQSGLIMECLERHFPKVQFALQGGLIYQIALQDVIHNFDESCEDDRALLKMLLLLDELAVEVPGLENLRATAIAFKPAKSVPGKK